MSVRHTHIFDRSGEFRFDAERLEIASAVARIRELANTSTDLALNKSVEATSEAENFPATNLVDGNAETSYKPDDGEGPHEVEIDLGRLLWLNKVEINFATDALPATAVVSVATESGGDYEEVVNIPEVSGNINQTFTATRARFVRVVFNQGEDPLEIISLALKGPTQYYDDRNLYLLTPAVLISEAEELLQSASVPAQTGIRYFWLIDGVAKYYDGAAWVNSDRTYDQASALANLPPLAEKSWVRLGVVLCSLDGTARPTITSCQLDAAAPAPGLQEPLLCVVSGTLRDATGDPLPGREVQVVAVKGASVLPQPRSVVTDSLGFFEITLERGLTGVKFKIYPEGTAFMRTIPNSATADFKDLT